MAKKKSRTPAPPRPVQAPKRRFEPQSPRRTRIYLIALGALAALLVTTLLAFTLRGGSEDAKTALADAGCTRETFESQGQRHVEALPKGFKYNSVPATSGLHQPQPLAPIVWGVYDEPVEQIKVVHNLEHGGVIVQYGPEVPAADRPGHRRVVPRRPEWPRRRTASAGAHRGEARALGRDRPNRLDVPPDVQAVQRRGVLELRRPPPRERAGALPGLGLNPRKSVTRAGVAER